MTSDIHGSDGVSADGGTARNDDGANRGEERPCGRTGRSPTGTAETPCPDRRDASERGAPDGTTNGSASASTTSNQTPASDRASVTDRTSASDRAPVSDSESPADESRFEERLRAVERAVTGTDRSVADLSNEAAATAEREDLAARLDDVEARVEELEAATQALRGYAGSIRAVNREVERRADLALARASDGDDSAVDPDTDPRERRREPDDAVPSEAALDAAVPSEPGQDAGRGSVAAAGTSGPSGDRKGETGTDPCGERNDDGSWPSDALDRLRESL